tara:strand:- start:319 stop:759 length:441 start_codon:yes stop_codon:yes gene_type:complete
MLPADVVNNIISFTTPAEIIYHTCFVVKKIYYDQIIVGEKKIEGRLMKSNSSYKDISKDDIIAFRPGQAAKIGCFARVTDIHRFKTFEEMLDFFGFLACLPTCPSKDEAIKVYNSLYKDNESMDVIAFTFDLIPFNSVYRKLQRRT